MFYDDPGESHKEKYISKTIKLLFKLYAARALSSQNLSPTCLAENAKQSTFITVINRTEMAG